MSNYATFGGQPVEDPHPLVQVDRRHGLPRDFEGHAMEYINPLGETPGRAWFLMRREHLDKLDLASKGGDSVMTDLKWVSDFDTLTIKLAVLKAVAQTTTYDSDPGTSYLLECVDRRHFFGATSVSRRYNVSAGCGDFESSSMDGEDPWTWQSALDDLFGELPWPDNPTFTKPQLPYSPVGEPENFVFHGTSAWAALHVILRRLSCTTAYDAVNDRISYVRLGDDQEFKLDPADSTTIDREEALSHLANRTIFDYDPLEYSHTRIPHTVRVFFRSPTAGDLAEDAVDFVDVPTDDANAVTGTRHTLWDNARPCEDTTPEDRAEEVVANWLKRRYFGELRDKTLVSGITTLIQPGSQTSKLVYRNHGDYDYGDGGLVTEIWNQPSPEMHDHVRFNPSGAGGWWIGFHIDEYFPGTRSAFCSINELPFGRTLGEVPDLGKTPAPPGTVIVCDPKGCYFDETNMVGREGYAVYAQPLKASICSEAFGSGSSGGLEPLWVVHSVCCPESRCKTPPQGV